MLSGAGTRGAGDSDHNLQCESFLVRIMVRIVVRIVVRNQPCHSCGCRPRWRANHHFSLYDYYLSSANHQWEIIQKVEFEMEKGQV